MLEDVVRLDEVLGEDRIRLVVSVEAEVELVPIDDLV